MRTVLILTSIAMLCTLLLSAVGPALAMSTEVLNTVTVGSIDPSLGYDTVVNGTTTFKVARKPSPVQGKFFHEVIETETRSTRIEASEETPCAQYDSLTGKYFLESTGLQSEVLSVPDPAGKVTVWSNVVFQGTGWNPKLKPIAHPDGTSQSILHVKGQARGDGYSRYLVVKVFNSQYPSGYQLEYSIVRNSFDKAYDVTGIVVQREVNNVSVVLTTYVGCWDVQAYFDVSTVGTDVYIAMISGVPACYVDSIDAVRRGVEASCMVKPLAHLDPWRPLTYLEITDMSTYQYVVEHPDYVKPPGFYGETGVILVNAHGEVFAVPSGYTWDSWLGLISQQLKTKMLTWVQVAGYPFYYYSYGSGQATEVTPQGRGFQLLLEPITGSNAIKCWPEVEDRAVNLGQEYASRLSGYGLVSGGLHEGRPIAIGASQPSDRDFWTETLTCSDGSWDWETPITIAVDTSQHSTGLASIKGTPEGFGGLPGIMSFTWNSGKAPNANNYPVLCFEVFLEHAINGAAGFTMNLLDSQSRMARSINYGGDNFPDQKWCSIAIRREEWGLVDAGFDWSSIREMWIICSRTYATYRFDHVYFDTGASTICHNLDLMYTQSGPVKYLTLGLVSFARPNQNVTYDQQVGYYVHNGAQYSDSDYNKGKYSMAVAAWTKIPLLASVTVEVFHDWGGGNRPVVGKVKCQLMWSKAELQGTTWKVSFVTATISLLNFTQGHLDISDPQAPLKVTDPAAQPTPCSFQFLRGESTILVERSHTSWERIVAETAFWTALSLVLAPFTAAMPPLLGLTAGMWVTIGLGGLKAGTSIALLGYGSPDPIESGQYIALAMRDNSNVDVVDASGKKYRQLQSYGVMQISLPKLDSGPLVGGAKRELSFEMGQKALYDTWFGGITTIRKTIVVEPRQTIDSNTPPQVPLAPMGPSQGFRNTLYSYNASTNDPEGDDVRYKFVWGDTSDPTLTGWYETGDVAVATHQWGSFNTYSVYVQVQDSQGAWNTVSSPLMVTIVPKLVISQSSGGTTNPAPGTYAYTYGSTATVTAIPANDLYYLDYWYLDSQKVYGNPKDVTMTADHTLTPHFRYVGGGCPILYTYDGTDFVCEGLLDIHDPTGTDVIARHTLLTKPEAINGAYQFQLVEHPQTISHIDQVNLFAILQNGEVMELPLIQARHSVYGNCRPELMFSDEWKVEELGADHNNGVSQSIGLRFRALPPNIKAQYFVFQIEGNNMIVKV